MDLVGILVVVVVAMLLRGGIVVVGVETATAFGVALKGTKGVVACFLSCCCCFGVNKFNSEGVLITGFDF